MSDGMYETFAWGRKSKSDKFIPMKIERNLPGPDDVQFQIKYCGICHSDVHQCDDDFGISMYPFVPGHELAGIVTAVGQNVTKYAIGDKVGVGCIADSCMDCPGCDTGEEHTCDKGMTGTYNGKTVHGHLATNSGYTFGGYSGSYTLHTKYVIKIPSSYPLEKAGPVFCSAITVYSPLAQHGALKGGKNIGVIGIGGLGQMGVMLAKAMGNRVTAISTTPKKKQAALEMGADNFIVSTDPASMKAGDNSLDLILNCVSANHQVALYIPLLRRFGTIVQLGVAMAPHSLVQLMLMRKRLSVSGSTIGGIRETQDCIDFCASHNIETATKLITWDKLDEVFEILKGKNDQVIRYVLDIEASKTKPAKTYPSVANIRQNFQ